VVSDDPTNRTPPQKGHPMADDSDTGWEVLSTSLIPEDPHASAGRLLTIPEAAAALRISQSSTYRPSIAAKVPSMARGSDSDLVATRHACQLEPPRASADSTGESPGMPDRCGGRSPPVSRWELGSTRAQLNRRCPGDPLNPTSTRQSVLEAGGQASVKSAADVTLRQPTVGRQRSP
jgi:hypothetical protein